MVVLKANCGGCRKRRHFTPSWRVEGAQWSSCSVPGVRWSWDGKQSRKKVWCQAGDMVESAPKLASKTRVSIRNDAAWPTVDTDNAVVKALGYVRGVQVEVLALLALASNELGLLAQIVLDYEQEVVAVLVFRHRTHEVHRYSLPEGRRGCAGCGELQHVSVHVGPEEPVVKRGVGAVGTEMT
eukprot:125016-Rhodomonas_salina.1